MKNYFKMRSSIISLIIFLFISTFAAAQKKRTQAIETENDSLKTELNKQQVESKALILKIRTDSANSANALNAEIEKLKKEMSYNSELTRLFLSRPHTYIFSQGWSKNYLSAEDVKFLIPNVVEASTVGDWNKAYDEKKPAYIYHQLDVKKECGVLLNVAAIKLLQDALANNNTGWKIPDVSDIEQLKKGLEQYKSSSFSMLTSSNTKDLKWTKKGTDLFGWNMLPLSFFDKAGDKWYGNTTASFFCTNTKEDANMEKSISLFEIDQASPNEIYVSKLLIDDGLQNYGLYIRLIKTNK